MSFVVKTLLGDLPPIDITAQHNVIDLKRCIDEMRPEFPLKRQRLFLSKPLAIGEASADSDEMQELVSNQQSLESYHVTTESKLVLLLAEPPKQPISSADIDALVTMIKTRDQRSITELLNARTGKFHLFSISFALLPDALEMLVLALLHNHSIETLALSMGRRVTIEQARAISHLLRNNISITEVTVHDSFLDDDIIAILAEGFTMSTTIRTLNLSGFRKVSVCGATALANILSHNSSVTSLDLSLADHISVYLPALGTNQTITELNLYLSQGWNFEQWAALANALKQNTTLISLDLSCTFIDAQGLIALIPGFAVNQTIRTLRLNSAFTLDQAQSCHNELAEFLQKASSLRSIDISGNQFSEEGVLKLAEIFDEKSKFTSLDMFRGLLSDKSMDALCHVLIRNTTLTEFKSAWNDFGHIGLASLINLLEHNTTLTKLSLTHCSTAFDTDGMELFTNALKRNNSLTDIDLSFITFNNDMFISVASMLSINTCITRFRIQTPIQHCRDGCGLAALATALQNNHTITDLPISMFSFPEPASQEIAKIQAICQRNSIAIQ